MDKKEEAYELDFAEKVLTPAEAQAVFKIQKEFLSSYAASKDKMTVAEWLVAELQSQLSDKSIAEIKEISSEIIEALTVTEKMKKSEEEALAKGRDKDSWFASTILQHASQMATQDSAVYLDQLDTAVKEANTAMKEAMTTKSSGYIKPSMNPNLDGYIAEQYHVNSFNMDAVAKGSGLRAEVQPLKPGQTYTKNGFDVVIKDAQGRRIHQYQLKYGKTAKDTIRMNKKGDYSNQILLVPEEQVEEVKKALPNKTVTSTISDGKVSSKPLTKAEAKKMAREAQKRNFMEMDWNEYKAKDLALGIGKQTGVACLQGAAIGAGMSIAKKVWDGEPIDGEEVVKTAVSSGTDFGVKAATAAALKTATEKDLLKAIPKSTKGSTYANIAFVAIEDAKILGKVSTGELTATEGLYEMGKTTAACVAGIATSAKGTAIGAAVGTVLGPVGTAVGGFVGGTVGYIVGSTAVQTAVESVKKVARKTVNVVSSAVESVTSRVGDTVRGLFSWF